MHSDETALVAQQLVPAHLDTGFDGDARLGHERLQARGNFFVEPQSQVYEGQVVGVNNKPEELDVNITLAKHMTNMRSATADVLETLTPPIKMSLEESLDFANEDECVEVTPESIRIRKIILNREDWYKWRAKQRRANNNATK